MNAFTFHSYVLYYSSKVAFCKQYSQYCNTFLCASFFSPNFASRIKLWIKCPWKFSLPIKGLINTSRTFGTCKSAAKFLNFKIAMQWKCFTGGLNLAIFNNRNVPRVHDIFRVTIKTACDNYPFCCHCIMISLNLFQSLFNVCCIIQSLVLQHLASAVQMNILSFVVTYGCLVCGE